MNSGRCCEEQDQTLHSLLTGLQIIKTPSRESVRLLIRDIRISDIVLAGSNAFYQMKSNQSLIAIVIC